MVVDYCDYSKKLALCELVAEVSNKVELTTDESVILPSFFPVFLLLHLTASPPFLMQSPVHEMAKKCGEKANAEVNFFRVILDAPFFQYDEDNVPCKSLL